MISVLPLLYLWSPSRSLIYTIYLTHFLAATHIAFTYIAAIRIEDFFKETPVLHNKPQFEVYDSLPPVVKITDNFDSLLIPPEHVSRKATDTYYVDDAHVLRTHTRY
jgi:tRNA synthetases class II core domain (F)